jgi:tRNA dimethylallyltransferase
VTKSQLQINQAKCLQALGCWYLVGATASGKSEVSLELARQLNAEIVALDSMTIYRGMDIGTAKPGRIERSQVPHHLIDMIEPNETFSVSRYRDAALSCIDAIRSRGKEVLFVGGSALYLKALLRGMFDGPPADWNFRDSVERDVDVHGEEALFERLKALDPVTATKLHANDRRRIIRALEVLHLTGQPISHWQMQFDDAHRSDECRVFALRHPRAVLHERIENRVMEMYARGLIDEVRGLLDRYTHLSRTASQAVGYCEAIEYLNGLRTHDEAREQTLVRTRRFARHQETWFRGLSECEFVEIAETDNPVILAERILSLGSSRR